MTSTREREPSKPIPLFGVFLFSLLFLSALFNGSAMLNTDGDLPRHLLMGKYVLETGAPPTSEMFAYPYAGRDYVPHEWLAGILFYIAYQAFELNGVVLLAGFLIGMTFLLVYTSILSDRHEPLLCFLLVLLGAVVTSIHWVTRPHLFTMVFLAIWMVMLDRLRRGERTRLWWFPAVMLFWANIHAEHIVGFLVLLAYLAGLSWSYLINRNTEALEKIKPILMITLLSFGASLVNPSGIKTWTTIVEYINNDYLMARIAETRQPDLLDSESMPLLILLIASSLLIAGNRTKFTLTDLFLISGFGLMSVVSLRNAHLFGVAAPLVLSHGLHGVGAPKSLKNVGQMIASLEARSRGGLVPVFTIVLMGIFLLAVPLKNNNRFDPAIFPVNAVRWLEDKPPAGRMFNAFDWGGYILFHLWPSQQVFIESQSDTTGDLTQQYETVVTLSTGWEGIFTQYEIRWAIIPPDWTLASELRDQGWVVTYEDETAVILVEK